MVILKSVLALFSGTKLVSDASEFSLDMRFTSTIKYKNKAVGTIQRNPEKKLVRCVKHDPPHKIQHIDVSYFSGYFL